MPMADTTNLPVLPEALARDVQLVDFVMLWNQRQGLPTPVLHMSILTWLEDSWRNGDRELLLLVFRDAGKSTLVGLFAAWLLLIQPNLRILVLAAEQALARKMVRNVKRIIERHPLTAGLKPKRRDQWAAEQFTVNRPLELRDPSMLARGLNGNITGSRADVVLCDDVEVPLTAATTASREELRQRLLEIDYVLVPSGTQLYIGTPHSYYSIYATEPRREIGEEASFLDGFKRLELPILNEDGQSRWPERFPLTRIERIRRRSGPAKFSSQLLLQPTAAEDGRLDPDLLRSYGDELDLREAGGRLVLSLGGKRLVSASAFWDPAFGAPRKGRAKGGDGSVVAAVFTDGDGRHYLHRIAYLQHDPERLGETDAATQLCDQVASFVQALHLPSIRVEGNGLGKFLPGLLRQALSRIDCGASVVEHVSHQAKQARILAAFDAPLAAGRLHAHDSVLASPLILEMREWRPGISATRDDGLDAVAGCLLAEPVRLTQAARPQHRDWRHGNDNLNARAEFDPLKREE